MEELKFLEEQNVSSGLIKKVLEFREMYPVPDEAADPYATVIRLELDGEVELFEGAGGAIAYN